MTHSPVSPIWIFLGLYFIPLVEPFCWKPNINPFTGAPNTERVDGTTVRVTWDEVFPKGRGCNDVEFLIKSHPLKEPANYKLSDLTLRGKRTAILAVPQGSDFIFQVIAREDKGTEIGIEYAYSRPATSLANPNKEQLGDLKKSLWIAGDTRASKRTGRQSAATKRTYAPPSTTSTTTPRTYLKPSVKSLDMSRYVNNFQGEYYDDIEEEVDGATGAPWYVYECVPLLKNLAGFESGSKKNSILTQFIKHMNKNSVSTVKSFVSNKKTCRSGYEGQESGHVVASEQGKNQCCSTPWGDNRFRNQAVCYDQFARCDGQCIPHDWVADGWPDCMDGADESDFSVDGKVLPYQLGCVNCAGVVLSSAFLCLESTPGLTRECVENILGPGQCNVCISEYMDLN